MWLRRLSFLLFTLVLISLVILGVFAWMQYGDISYLVLEGDVPDAMTGVQMKSPLCSSIPCKVSVVPGDALVTFYKNGYYSMSKRIRLSLFEEQTVNLQFHMRPVLTEVRRLYSTEGLYGSRSTDFRQNQDEVKWTYWFRLPDMIKIFSPLQDIREVSWSPTGSGAIIRGDTGSIFLQDGKAEKVFLPAEANHFVWDDDQVFYWDTTAATGIKRLSSLSCQTCAAQTEAVFYNISDGDIYPSKQYILVTVEEKNYLVMRSDARKKTILEDQVIRQAKWSPLGDSFLFRTKNGNLFHYAVDTDTITPLDPVLQGVSFELVDYWRDSRHVVYIDQANGEMNVRLYNFDTAKTGDLLSESRTSPMIGLQTYRQTVFVLNERNMLYRLDGEVFTDD